MDKLALTKARESLPDTISRVCYGKERLIITRNGKDAVVLVPMEDLALLEAVEDGADLKAAEAALREAKRKGEKPVGWKRAKKELGV